MGKIFGLITGIFVGVVFIGSIGLFLSKVANANILPIDINAEPYTTAKRTVDIGLIYMNPVKQLCCYGLGFWADPSSYRIQEANFVNPTAKLDYMENFKNTWLCSLGYKANPITSLEYMAIIEKCAGNDIKEKMQDFLLHNDMPRKSAFWEFEYETLKPMLCTSFTIVSNIFYYMNYLPEWATMLFFALFFSVILTIVYIGNFIYSVFSHVSHLSDFWNNLWEDKYNKGISRTTPGFNWISTCFFFFLYLTPVFWSAIMTPAFITLYTFYKALLANYVVRKHEKEDPPKQMNFISFVKNVMYYKKTFIIILVMFNLMAATNEYLGVTYLPGVIIAVLILIFSMNVLAVDEPLELFTASIKVDFPPLKHPIVKIDDGTGTPVKNCVADAVVKDINTDESGNKISMLTGQKINVLLSNDTKITSGGKNFKV